MKWLYQPSAAIVYPNALPDHPNPSFHVIYYVILAIYDKPRSRAIPIPSTDLGIRNIQVIRVSDNSILEFIYLIFVIFGPCLFETKSSYH